MKNASNIGFLLLRVSFSALLLTHGIPKLQMLVSGGEIKFGDPIGLGVTTSLVLAVLGEAIAPIFIIIGYKTKLAAFFPFATMAVAALIVHGSDPLGVKEMALSYMFAFLCIMLLGAGKYSIDGRKK